MFGIGKFFKSFFKSKEKVESPKLELINDGKFVPGCGNEKCCEDPSKCEVVATCGKPECCGKPDACDKVEKVMKKATKKKVVKETTEAKVVKKKPVAKKTSKVKKDKE